MQIGPLAMKPMIAGSPCLYQLAVKLSVVICEYMAIKLAVLA